MLPFAQLILCRTGTNANGMINADILNIQIMSTSINFKLSILIGFIMEVIPNTEPILNIFEPTKFPNDKSFSFFKAEIMEAANSGMLVPMATILTPITLSLTPN